KLDDGSPNPNAVGVLFESATFAFVKVGTKYAIRVTGTGSLVGVSGVTLSATLSIAFNDTPSTQNLGGVDGAPDSTKKVSATNVTFTVAGLSLTGNFEVTFDATGKVSGIHFTNVGLTLGENVLTVSALTGTLTFDPTGIFGTVNGNVAL